MRKMLKEEEYELVFVCGAGCCLQNGVGKITLRVFEFLFAWS
jgi:hypothetical protein